MIIRLAQSSDYSDVLEICEKIWDGDDYIPYVFNKWVSHPELGECLVVEDNKKVIGITRTTYLSDAIAWFEGIRVHHDYRGQKIGKLLADEQFKRAYEMGFSEIQLSSYIDNTESIAMIEKRGFNRIGEWIFMCLGDLTRLTSFASNDLKLVPDDVEALGEMQIRKKMDGIYPIDFVFTTLEGVKRHWWNEISVEKIYLGGEFLGRLAWMRNIKYPDQLNIIAIDSVDELMVPSIISALYNNVKKDGYEWIAIQYPESDQVYRGLIKCGFETEHNGMKETFHYQYKQRR